MKKSEKNNISILEADASWNYSQPEGAIEFKRKVPSDISQAILEGAQKSGGKLGKTVFIEGNRGKAIDFAINVLAKKGDTIGIFGKGHEQSINLDGKKELPWSDKEAVLKALRK